MVLARLVAVLAVVCVAARGASALTLEGVRAPHGQPRPPLHAPRDDYLPDDLALDRYEEAQLLNELQDPLSPTSHRFQQLISELAEAAAAADSLENGPDGVPLPAEVAEAVAEAEAAAVMNGAATGGSWGSAGVPTDPRYMLVNEYLARAAAAESNSNSNNRKARDSRNSRSVTSSSTTTTNNNTTPNLITNGGTTTTTTTNANTPSNMYKRAWPHNFSRRRSSGLSLSIDASMKVLREALYLEIARKKQRQQLQRAQHNKALLNTIGKRDVASQLQDQHHQHGAAAFNDDRN